MTRLSAKTAVLLTLPPLLWAGNAVIGRLLVGSVAPLTLNFLRWSVAALLLLPLGWRALRADSMMWKRWPRFATLALLGVASYNAFQYLALQTSTPINVTLIAASMPLWMLVAGALLYRERPLPRQVAGALLSLTGVVIVISRGDAATLLQLRLVPGDVYILVAVASWAVYSWMLARPGADDSARHMSWAEFLFAQVVLGAAWAGVAAASERFVLGKSIDWSPVVVAALVYIAVGPALIAYRCWGIGVAVAGPSVTALFSNLTPIFAALLSAAILGEPPAWFHAVAFALIVAGIVVSSRR